MTYMTARKSDAARRYNKQLTSAAMVGNKELLELVGYLAEKLTILNIATAIHRVAERSAADARLARGAITDRTSNAAEGRGRGGARARLLLQLPCCILSPSPERRARAQAWTELSSSRPTLAIQQPAATQPIAVCGT